MRNWKTIDEAREWLKNRVFTLPMRNWKATASWTFLTWVRFLLYLWGIERFFVRRDIALGATFYFTYEELKENGIRWTRSQNASFYFTYEELKVARCNNLPPISCGFLLYLWGIESCKCIIYRWIFRRFLLYLWGIERCRLRLQLWLKSQFLLYLWGIESKFTSPPIRFGIISFYFTYEELKD